MKLTLIASAFFLLLHAATISAQDSKSAAEGPASTPQEELGPLSDPRHIGIGMTPAEVETAMLGKPDVVLAPDLWVYWGFRIAMSPGAQKFDTLVIYFSDNRVVKYRLVERKAMQALIAAVRKAAGKTQTVASK